MDLSPHKASDFKVKAGCLKYSNYCVYTKNINKEMPRFIFKLLSIPAYKARACWTLITCSDVFDALGRIYRK